MNKLYVSVLVVGTLSFVPALVLAYENRSAPPALLEAASLPIQIPTFHPEVAIVQPQKQQPVKSEIKPVKAQPKIRVAAKPPRWVCSPPRPLEQGSGTVKECEFE